MTAAESAPPPATATDRPAAVPATATDRSAVPLVTAAERSTPPPAAADVSLIGLGPMGEPMARNLLAALGPIAVFNRTRSKADALAPLGAVVASTPAEAARPVTLTVLPDLPQVEALLTGDDGLLAGWAARAVSSPVLVVHGTVSPVDVAQLAERMLAEHGVRVVDAPLSGGTAGAASATLSIMVGADPSTFREVAPVFDLLGTTVRYLGPSGSGATAKICNQIVVAAGVAALSESMQLARSAGLDLEVLQQILQGGLARTEIVAQKGMAWQNLDFSGGGSAKNQLKDLRFIAQTAAAAGLDLPTTAAVTTLFEQMVDAGDGDLDHTGVYLTIERNSRADP